MSKVYLALQDNDMSRYIVEAVEADNPNVTVIYQPAMIRMEREDSLVVRRSTVEEQLGQSWAVQALHPNLIPVGGNVDEDDEQFSLSWQR